MYGSSTRVPVLDYLYIATKVHMVGNNKHLKLSCETAYCISVNTLKKRVNIKEVAACSEKSSNIPS